MNIAGLEKCSCVDYPGRLAAVVFTAGCNWNCFYCHNRPLLNPQGGASRLAPETVLDWLARRRGFLDAVVISGGEPTLQAGLDEFIRAVRALGFAVKLDTNGTRPAVLRALLEEHLLDFVAMDIKAPLEKYEAVCGVPVDPRALDESIELLLAGEVDYEFRTTVIPQLTADDVRAIAARIRGAKRYVLQQYRRPADGAADPRCDAAPHGPAWPWTFVRELEGRVKSYDVRGFRQSATTAATSVA